MRPRSKAKAPAHAPAARSRAAVLSLASVLAVVVTAATGCATSYVYRPLAPAAEPGSGGLVARYPAPPEAPAGEVLITSFGVTRMTVGPDTEAPLLHVRLGASVGASAAGTTWTIDAREQLASIVGAAPQPPTFANSDAGGPVVYAGPGQQRVMDLYYALPAGRGGEGEVPGFDFSWTVHAGARVVAERTPFQRAEGYADGGTSPAYFAVGLGWSPWWWYGPFWPYSPAFVRFRPRVVRYAPPAYVHTPGPAGTFHGRPGGSGTFRGAPPASGGGGFRGAPTRGGGGGGFRGRPAR